MKGLALSRAYYEAFGLPMLAQNYPDYQDRIAVGFAGEGSDCFGYDDEISADHDFGPRFCLWLTDEDFSAIGKDLDTSYRNLPSEFMGYQTEANTRHSHSRHGVKRISDYYRDYTGCPKGPRTWQEWIRIPDHLLAACINGAVFSDRLGLFTEIRNHIAQGMPEDVRRKKIAARAFSMAQSGQYNFSRCLKHREPGAAHLALSEFVTSAVKISFLLNRAYSPYYKWMFRGLRDLAVLSELHAPLFRLITNEPADSQVCCQLIEEVSASVIRELLRQHLTDGDWDYLEPHAMRILDSIRNPDIRGLHITIG